MNGPGFIIPNTTIAVDYWSKKDSQLVTHHFLTHAHTDHTKGLSSAWTNAKIYCSKITKNLINYEFGISNDLIHELEIGTSHIMKLNDTFSFNVELIDANHCPGAVMFLFVGYFGCVLATGDFRYDDNFTHKFTTPIDQCFLDTTYLKQSLSGKIPTRDEAFKEILAKVDDCFRKSIKVAIILRKLGKEDLVLRLAKHFKCKILIRSHDRWHKFVNIFGINTEMLIKAPNDDLFFIEICDKFEICCDDDYFFIEPTALTLLQSTKISNPHLFSVAYTDHSSYDEILRFIKTIQPKSIVPIVDCERSDLQLLVEQLSLNQEKLRDSSKEYRLLIQNLNQNDFQSDKHQMMIKVQTRKKSLIKEIQYEDNCSPIKKRQKIQNDDNFKSIVSTLEPIDEESNISVLSPREAYLKSCKESIEFIKNDLKNNNLNIYDQTFINNFLYSLL